MTERRNIGVMHYDICLSDHRAVHLKHLIMTDFNGNFGALKNFISLHKCDKNLLHYRHYKAKFLSELIKEKNIE